MKVLYLSGRGGELDHGLGRHLQSRATEFGGVAFNDATLSHSFGDQITAVQQLLHDSACDNTYLIANSYGCYVLLHALIDQPLMTTTKVLLLSPLLGRTHLRAQGFSSRPPRLKRLDAALNQGLIIKPHYLALIAGADDPICEPAELQNIAGLLQADHWKILPKQGHMIDHDVMNTVLTEFFAT